MKKVKIILIIIRIISVLVWRAVGLKMGRKEFVGLRVNYLSLFWRIWTVRFVRKIKPVSVIDRSIYHLQLNKRDKVVGVLTLQRAIRNSSKKELKL